MDDIKVMSKSLQEHLEHMAILCVAAESVGFQFKLKKCQFNQEEITIWGIICSKDGRMAEPKKVDQLINWPEPTSVQALWELLGVRQLFTD